MSRPFYLGPSINYVDRFLGVFDPIFMAFLQNIGRKEVTWLIPPPQLSTWLMNALFFLSGRWRCKCHYLLFQRHPIFLDFFNVLCVCCCFFGLVFCWRRFLGKGHKKEVKPKNLHIFTISYALPWRGISYGCVHLLITLT